MIPVPTKFPVYIISHQRTRSSILMSLIAEKYNLKIFCEPEQSNSLTSISELVEYDTNNRNYVLKVHGHNLYKYPQSIIDKLYSNDIFKINIRRMDRASQVASNLVAFKRNIWKYTPKDLLDNNEFKFSDKMIDTHIKYIDDCYQIIDNLNINYDCTIYSEDIGVIKHSDHAITPLPSNYEELLTAIRKRIDNGN